MADDQILGRIRALLAKAADTDFPEEAKVFAERAQELMAKYQIDQALLRSASHDPAERPVVRTYTVQGPYAAAKLALWFAVFTTSACKGVSLGGHGDGGTRRASFVGFASDLAYAETLTTVLEAQCVTAMMRATNPSPRDSTRKFRSDFVVGFAAEIRERLRERRRRATREYGAASAASVALVMRDRSAIVDDAFRREFPHVRSGRARRVGAGYGSGRRAGTGADIGSVRLRGGRRAIGAG